MSSSRDTVLGSVRRALAPLGQERARLPDWDPRSVVTLPEGADLLAAFAKAAAAVRGQTIDNLDDLVDSLRKQNCRHGYLDPSLKGTLQEALAKHFSLEHTFDRSRIDDYDFGITRACGAIAETGTVILDDASSASRLAGLAPWIHVAVLSRETLWPDIPSALAHLGDDPNVVWITGPSKTADVEGILIEGVHGPGVQICLVV